MSGPPGGGGGGGLLALHNTFETFYGHLGLTGSKREALWNNFKAGGKAQADSVLHTIVPPSQESRGNPPQPSPPVDQSGRAAPPPAVDQSGRGAPPPVDQSGRGASPQVDQSGREAPQPSPPVDQSGRGAPSPVDQSGRGASPAVDQSGRGASPQVDQSTRLDTSEFDTWANSLPGLTVSQREALQNNYNRGGLGAAQDIYTKHYAPRPPVDQSTRQPPPQPPPQPVDQSGRGLPPQVDQSGRGTPPPSPSPPPAVDQTSRIVKPDPPPAVDQTSRIVKPPPPVDQTSRIVQPPPPVDQTSRIVQPTEPPPPQPEYTQGDNNAPPPAVDGGTLPPHLMGGGGPPGGNTSFVTSNEVTTQDPVEVKLPWEEDEVENVVWQPKKDPVVNQGDRLDKDPSGSAPPRMSMGAANRVSQGDRLDKDPVGSAPPSTTVVGNQGDRLDQDPAGSAPPPAAPPGNQGDRLDKDPPGSAPPPKSTEWWTQKDRLDQDPPGGGDGSVKKGWDWSNFQGDRPDQDPSGSAPPPAISPGGQETRLDQDPVGSSPPPAGAPPPAQGGPGDFPPPTDDPPPADPPPGGLGPGDIPAPPPGEPPPASPPPADPPPATQPLPAEANPLAFLGRGNQTGIEQRLQQISNQIEVDAEAEVRRQQAVAEQQFQTQREDLARMFSISPGSRGANLSGDQQRDFEQLASAEAQTLANIDAQVRAQARAEGRENLATLLGIQSGVQAGDLAVRGQGLEETQVFGEEQGASMADFGIPAGTQLTMDNLDQMSQIVQSGFFQKFNRAPTNGELMTILQGGTTGGTTTLAAEAQKSATAAQERQLDITEAGQERQLDIAETGQERELDLAEQAQEFAEETGRARTDLAERAQEYAEEAGRAQIGLQSAELFGGTEGLTMGSLGIDPNASDFDQFAAFDKFGEAFNSQYNRPPTAEEMDDFLQGKAVGARKTFQSSQFGQTFAESTRQFNSTFLGDMIDPATGQIREGLDKQQVQAGINKLNADMGNAERALTADIAQQWSQITGETTSEGPVTLSDLTGMDSEGIGRALMDGSMTQEQVLNSVRQGFTAMTGREPTDEELNALSSAGTVNVMGAPTLEAKRLASTVSQANMDRAVSYKQIATQEGLDYEKIRQLDEQADKEWQRITLDVASQIGVDSTSWQGAVQAYEKAVRDGFDPDTALDKAHAASRHPTTGEFMEMGDLNRGISIWTRDFGSSNEQLRRSFEMQEDQFERTIDGLSRQEERENAVWNGLLGTNPVNVQLDALLGSSVEMGRFDLEEAIGGLQIELKNGDIFQPTLQASDQVIRDAAESGDFNVIPVEVPMYDPDGNVVRDEGGNIRTTTEIMGKLDELIPGFDISDVNVEDITSGFSAKPKNEQYSIIRQRVENRHNITLDNSEIENVLRGQPVTIQPAPRDILARFGKDAELLNAFTSWVSGASPFSNPESGPGLAATIGSFAGNAAVGFASGGGGTALGKGLVEKFF